MNWHLVLKILIILLFTAGYVELHEYVHATNCEYAGGNATRLNFRATLCQIDEDNPLTAQIHWFDVLNEVIASIFVPLFLFIMIAWIYKTEK